MADIPADKTTLPRAPMVPAEMIVLCPGCERPHNLESMDWGEAPSGAYVVADHARFPVCEYCDLQFEVAAVAVTEAPRA